MAQKNLFNHNEIKGKCHFFQRLVLSVSHTHIFSQKCLILLAISSPYTLFHRSCLHLLAAGYIFLVSLLGGVVDQLSMDRGVEMITSLSDFGLVVSQRFNNVKPDYLLWADQLRGYSTYRLFICGLEEWNDTRQTLKWPCIKSPGTEKKTITPRKQFSKWKSPHQTRGNFPSVELERYFQMRRRRNSARAPVSDKAHTVLKKVILCWLINENVLLTCSFCWFVAPGDSSWRPL